MHYLIIFISILLIPTIEAGINITSSSNKLRYSDITWICTHDSMNALESGWLIPNQTRSIQRQLEDGVHAQMWDVWEQKGEIVLRHGPSWTRFLGSSPISKSLQVLKSYLEKQPEAIITLFFESYVTAESLAHEIKKSGLEHYIYTHDKNQDWPTLEFLRSSNKRLILFTDKPDPRIPGLMPMWEHCKDTPWKASKPQDLKNTLQRGNPENQLLIVNHFTAHPLPDYIKSLRTNKPDFVLKRYMDIKRDLGQKPQFWVLDFYEQYNIYKLIP